MDYVITLVHGTWGRHSSFVDVYGPLWMSLEDICPGAVAISVFRWSGRNSIAARDAAVYSLREFLRRRLDEYPRAQHFIVAHSHGGNVAVRAASAEGLRTAISGIACLSTPFVDASMREVESAMSIPVAQVAVLIGAVEVALRFDIPIVGIAALVLFVLWNVLDMLRTRRELELIRFRGHLPKGGYDVRNGRLTQPTSPSALHG